METKGMEGIQAQFCSVVAVRAGSCSEPGQQSLPKCLPQREGSWQGRQGPRAASGGPGASGTSLSPTFSRKAFFCPLLPQPAGHLSGTEVGDIKRTSFPPSISGEGGLPMNGKGQ